MELKCVRVTVVHGNSTRAPTYTHRASVTYRARPVHISCIYAYSECTRRMSRFIGSKGSDLLSGNPFRAMHRVCAPGVGHDRRERARAPWRHGCAALARGWPPAPDRCKEPLGKEPRDKEPRGEEPRGKEPRGEEPRD